MSGTVSRKKEPWSLQLGRYDDEAKRSKSRERNKSLTETAVFATQSGSQKPSSRLSLKKRHTQQLSQADRHAELSKTIIQQGRRKSDMIPSMTRARSTTRLPSEKPKAPPEEIVILSRAERIRRGLPAESQKRSYSNMTPDLNSTGPLKLPSAQELQKAKSVNQAVKPLKRSGSVPRNLPSEKRSTNERSHGKKNGPQSNNEPPPGVVILSRAERARLGLPAVDRRKSFQHITSTVLQAPINLNSTAPLRLPSAEKAHVKKPMKSTAKKTKEASKHLIRSGSVPRNLPSEKQAVFERLSKSKSPQQAYEDPPPSAVILSRAERARRGLPDAPRKGASTSLLHSPSTDTLVVGIKKQPPTDSQSMNETALLAEDISSLKIERPVTNDAPQSNLPTTNLKPVIAQLPLNDSILTRNSSLIKRYKDGNPTIEMPSPNSSISFEPQTRFSSPDDQKENDLEDHLSTRLEGNSPGRAKLLSRNNKHPYVLQFMVEINDKRDWMTPEKDLVQHSHRITQRFNDEFNVRRKDILAEIRELEKEIGQLTNELSIRMVELSTLNTELERLDPDLTDLHEQLEERYGELQKEHREISIQIEKLEAELKPLNEKIEAIGGDSFLVEGPSDWDRATDYLKAFDEPYLKAIFFPTVLEMIQEAGYFENKSSQSLSCWDIYCTLLQERKAAQSVLALDCRNLKLKRLPPCIEKLQFPNLTSIYLDNNDFDEIPNFKSIAPAVRTISCNRNNILEVSSQLFVDHNSLTQLNLAYQNANGRRMTRMPYKLLVGSQADKEIIVDLRGNQINVEAHRFSETMRKFKFTFKMAGNPENNLPRLTNSVERSLEVGNITVTWKE